MSSYQIQLNRLSRNHLILERERERECFLLEEFKGGFLNSQQIYLQGPDFIRVFPEGIPLGYFFRNMKKEGIKKSFIIHCPKCHGVVMKECGVSDIDGVGLGVRCPHCHTNLRICLSKTFDIEVKEVKTADSKE